MKYLPLLLTLLFTSPALPQNESGDKRSVIAKEQELYQQRVSAAREKYEREIQRAKELFQRQLERALQKAVATGNKEDEKLVTDTLQALIDPDKADDVQKDLNARGNEEEQRAEANPMAFTSRKELFQAISKEWLQKDEFPDNLTRVQFSDYVDGLFVGKSYRGKMIVRTANVRDPDENGRRVIKFTTGQDKIFETNSRNYTCMLIYYVLAERDSPYLKIKSGDKINISGMIREARGGLADRAADDKTDLWLQQHVYRPEVPNDNQ